MDATTKDLRLRARELLAAADRGEEVVITWRGTRRAKLVRWIEPRQRVKDQRNPAFGIWADQEADVDEQVRALRRRRDLP